MNNITITRRALAKGATWSAPAIAATSVIPAYAASPKYTYFQTSTWQATTSQDSNFRTVTNLTTNVQNGKERPHYTVSYVEGLGIDTTAHLDFLKFYVVIPKELDTQNFSLRTGVYWQLNKKIEDGSFSLNQDDGTPINVQDKNVYEFVFSGPNSNQVVTERARASWPQTGFTATFYGNSYRGTDLNKKIYAGYKGSFKTDSGFQVPGDDYSQNLISINPLGL